MPRKAGVTLYQLVKTPQGNRYSRMTKAARGWAQARLLEGEPGSYYLRLRKNGKPTFESVGDDLANAVQEMKARQKAIANHAPVVVLAPRLTLHSEEWPCFAAPAAPKAGTRKPMSEEAKQKIRDAQLRRHQASDAASTT